MYLPGIWVMQGESGTGKEAWMREFGRMYLAEKLQTNSANRAMHNDVESKQKTNLIQIYTLGVWPRSGSIQPPGSSKHS
jgi:hypothetical protein